MAAEKQSADETVKQGVDLDALGEFLDYAEVNPEDVQFELGATGLYEGRAIHTTAKTGSYTLGGEEIDRIARETTYHFGGHKEVEDAVGFVDPTDRPEVTETTLAALCGCLNAAISMSALAAGVDLDELETTVSIEWDPFVFLHLDDIEVADGTPRDMFGDLQVEFAVAGEDVNEEALRYVEESAGRSAVYNLLTLAHDCEPKAVRKSG